MRPRPSVTGTDKIPLADAFFPETTSNAWSTVIGVVANVKHAGLDAETNPETYYDYRQIPAT